MFVSGAITDVSRALKAVASDLSWSTGIAPRDATSLEGFCISGRFFVKGKEQRSDRTCLRVAPKTTVTRKSDLATSSSHLHKESSFSSGRELTKHTAECRRSTQESDAPTDKPARELASGITGTEQSW